MWKDDSKNSPSYYLYQVVLLIAITSALILFMPKAMLGALKLTTLIEQSAHFVGICFMLSATYLAIDIINTLINNSKTTNNQLKLNEQIHSRIKTLTSGERAVLREFYLQRQTSLWLPSNECDVKSLLTSGVLIAVDYYASYRISEQGIKEVELMISHPARQHLTKSRLKLPQGKPNGDDIIYLKHSRPSYLTPVANFKRSA